MTKKIWFAVAGVTVLLVAAVVALPFVLDVERYRARIESTLTEATGWQASLGEIDLSILGGLRLTVAPASLVAAEGSRVELERIDISASMLPLLRGRLDVRAIELLRPTIELVRPGVERGWVLPLPRPTRTDEAPSAPAATDEPRGSADPTEDEPAVAVAVETIRVVGGTLTIEDRSVEPPLGLVVEDVEIDVAPSSGTMNGHGALAGEAGRVEWVASRGQLRLTLAGVTTDAVGRWAGEGIVHPGGRLDGDVEIARASLSGVFVATDLRLLAGEHALDRVEATVEARGTDDGGWELDRFTLETDGARVSGSGSLLPVLDLTLEMLPTPTETALRLARALFPLPLELHPPGQTRMTLHAGLSPPGDLVYRAAGSIEAGRLVPGGGLPDLTDVRASFDLSPDGRFALDPIEGRVGVGWLRGALVVPSIDPLGSLSFDGTLADASLGDLLAGFVDGAAEQIHGATGLEARIGLDLSREQLDARALGGRLTLGAEGLEAEGWDLEHAIREGIERKLGELGQIAALFDRSGKGEDRSPEPTALVERLEGAVVFDQFPWKIDGLTLVSGHVTGLGEGSFDPLTGRIELDLSASVDAATTARLRERHSFVRKLVREGGELTVPLEIRGTPTAPSIQVDLERILGGDSDDGDDVENAVRGLLDKLLD